MPVIELTDTWSGEKSYVDSWRDPLYDAESWIDGTGHEWAIGDMRTTHIQNVIGYVRRHSRWYAMRALQSMQSFADSPLGAGGDMAMEAQDAALDELWHAAYHRGEAFLRAEDSPLIRALKAELVMRYEP